MRHAVQSARVLLITGLPTASRTIGGEPDKNRQLVMELDRLAVETMPCSVSGWRLRPLATGPALVRLIRESSQIIISVATRGLFALALSPLSAMLGRKRVCVLAIGGILNQHIVELRPPLKARVQRLVQRADEVAVETSSMATNMNQLRYRNVMRLPNFRAMNKVGQDRVDQLRDRGMLQCVFLSRLTETKGIGDAVAAVARVQEPAPACQCFLDAYGPLEGVNPAVWPTSLVHYRCVSAKVMPGWFAAGRMANRKNRLTASRAGFTYIPISHWVSGFVAGMAESRVAVLFNHIRVGKGKTHFDTNHLMPMLRQRLGR